MRANLGFDWFFIGYCLMSLTIAIICDAEAVLHDPATYGKVEPLVNWPPQAVVLALHDWCRRFDPLLGARPLWFLVCFYMEMTLQVPYYIAATYAFLHGCEWIRVPTLVYASMSMTTMAIVLVEQFFGEFATPAPLVILGSYLPFAIAPVFFLYRARGTTMFAAKTKQA
ncbi:hypothetical protein SDRG_03092 [Saprolegnia diclina VS20]|uniref:EXPERA domain-containing protein n=1 Tax=Saprolegnia diclina (strain VS20) TaxID=1156394 RepID=T0S3N9_SAPDV|nr:hypothetical protein SDRG_03092 [Saprolegnia diclina VS20]EQC39663.1 hypothetical protein SDRG_03092 [Saprolegnia diclina VS20]|eukprot:XP_008606935.1 hypothetical protein SDRG_03092 [Saprolegnia diclina VS20]